MPVATQATLHAFLRAPTAFSDRSLAMTGSDPGDRSIINGKLEVRNLPAE